MPTSFHTTEKTNYNDVPLYKVALTEKDEEIFEVIRRYQELLLRTEQRAIDTKKGMTEAEKRKLRKIGGVRTQEEKNELAALEEKIREYQKKTKSNLKSVLRRSILETAVGAGKDSKVVSDAQDSGYVFKYSNREATPEVVLYLRNKYAILKKFMRDCIPESRFILGERKNELEMEKIRNYTPQRMCAITLQRRVFGETFQNMTSKEKKTTDVIESLRIAHRKYIMLKS